MNIWSVILGIIGSLISVQAIKMLMNKLLSSTAGEASKLGHTAKLAIGIVISFIFASVLQAGLIPGIPPLEQGPLVATLVTAASKAVYDLINDLKNQLITPKVP